MSKKMSNFLYSLANVAMVKNDTVHNLVLAKKELTTNVKNLSDTIVNIQLRQPVGTIPSAVRVSTGIGSTGWKTGLEKPPWYQKGYWYTHSFKLQQGHNSMNWSKPMSGHKREATRYNNMGGRTWNEGWQKPQWRGRPSKSEWYRLANKIITYIVNSISTNSVWANPTNLNDTPFLNSADNLSLIGLDMPENFSLVHRGGKFPLKPSGHQWQETESVEL